MRTAFFAAVCSLFVADLAFGQGQSIQPYTSDAYNRSAPWQSQPNFEPGPIFTPTPAVPLGASFVPPTASNLSSSSNISPSAFSMTLPPDTLRLQILLPANGKVRFGDSTLQQAAGDREYISPTLVPGKEYTYDIHAKWVQNGKEMSQDRTVTFRAGDRLRLDFNQPKP